MTPCSGRRSRLTIVRRFGCGLSSKICRSGRSTTIYHSGRAIAMSDEKKNSRKSYQKKGLRQGEVEKRSFDNPKIDVSFLTSI